LSINTVDISVYYNDGIQDPYSALQDWLSYDEKGKFLKEYDARLVYLDKDETDTNFMNNLHAQFALPTEHFAAYKFRFQSIK
jgi:hypothetical protein